MIWIADSRYVKQGTDRPAAPDLSSARLVPREQAVWKKHSCQEPPACSGLQCDTCHLKVDCSLVQKSRVEEEARVWSRHKLLREHGLHKLIRGTNFSEEVTAQTPQRTRAAQTHQRHKLLRGGHGTNSSENTGCTNSSEAQTSQRRSRHKLLREHGLHKLIRGTNFSEEVTAQTPQRTRAALVTRMTMGKRRLTALKNCDLGGGWVHCPASVQLCQEYGSLFVRFFLT